MHVCMNVCMYIYLYVYMFSSVLACEQRGEK